MWLCGAAHKPSQPPGNFHWLSGSKPLSIAKVASPKVQSDFRPISLTSVLTRIMERTVVSTYSCLRNGSLCVDWDVIPCSLTRNLYRPLKVPYMVLTFADQFAFCPAGSAIAILISIFQAAVDMLAINPYVTLIVLNFTKASDSVRCVTLLEKSVGYS